MTAILSRLFPSRRELPPQVERYGKLVKQTDRKARLEETEFVAFDTELTGTDFARDSVISIGAVRLRGGRILAGENFYRLIKPESALKGGSVPVHELTHADLADAGEPPAVLTDFLEFIGGAVLVGHFVNVDLNFVNRSLKRHFGITLGNPAVDTSAIQEWLYDNDSTFKKHFGGAPVAKDLYSMARNYGVEVQKSHNAFNDAYLTAQLFQRFLHFLIQAGVGRLDELASVGKF